MQKIKIVGLVLILWAILIALACKEKSVNPQALFVQVERMGIPTVNTALIPSSMKDAFNQGAPKDDVANFRSTAENSITSLRAAVNAVPGFPAEDSPGISPAALAAILIPDVVTIDFAQAVQFPNGRRLEDDVIDAALGLVLNRGSVLSGGPGVSDAINSNDALFLSVFPYLASENLPPLTSR